MASKIVKASPDDVVTIYGLYLRAIEAGIPVTRSNVSTLANRRAEMTETAPDGEVKRRRRSNGSPPPWAEPVGGKRLYLWSQWEPFLRDYVAGMTPGQRVRAERAAQREQARDVA